MKNVLLDKGIILPSGEISKDKVNLVTGAITQPFAEMVWVTTGGDMETVNRLTKLTQRIYRRLRNEQTHQKETGKTAACAGDPGACRPCGEAAAKAAGSHRPLSDRIQRLPCQAGRRGKEDSVTNACKTPEAVMQTLITALAAGLAVWGAVQLLESFQSGGERQRAQALDLIKAGGELVRTATWEVIPPSRP